MSVFISLVDWLNPGFGYQIRIQRGEETVLFTSNHPKTGKPLTYKDCVEIANSYDA